MKLKTSFSELTPLKKDITRFAPVWVLYLVGTLMVLMNTFDYGNYGEKASTLPELIQILGIVNMIYAAVCALLLFGDLYNTRMCYSLHALPQRRETWLLSHLAAGFGFSLVPNLVVTLLVMGQFGSFGYLMFYVLLAQELQFLFFFGLAAVSVMVTGNRFAMLLVYAGLNFVSMLVWWIADTIYLPLLYGVELEMEPFVQICPVVRIFNFEYMEFESEQIYDASGRFEEIVYTYEGLGDGWGYLAVLGVLGLVLMGVALVLYRIRHLESAGDFVAFSKLKIPMLVVMTICVGGVMAVMGELIFGDNMWLWLMVGVIIGYFGGMMLLERRVKVFRPKSLIGFGVLVAVLICSYILVSTDAFGIVRWVPKADQVESVILANFNSNGVSYSDYHVGNRISVELDEKQEIQDIIEAHQDIVDRYNGNGGYVGNSRHRVVLTYKLKSGRVVKREYWAPASGKNYEIVSQYFYTPQTILGYQDWDSFLEIVQELHVSGYEIPKEYQTELLEMLRKDCAIGKIQLEGNVKELLGYVYLRTQRSSRSLAILPGADATVEFLRRPEIILGYSDWDKLLSGLSDVYVGGQEVKAQHYQGLMEAVKADCAAGNISLLEEYRTYQYMEYYVDGQYRMVQIPNKAVRTLEFIASIGL